MKRIVKLPNGKTRTFNTNTAVKIATLYTQGYPGYNLTYNYVFWNIVKTDEYFCTYNGNLYTDYSKGIMESDGSVKNFLNRLIEESQFVFYDEYPDVSIGTNQFMVIST